MADQDAVVAGGETDVAVGVDTGPTEGVATEQAEPQSFLSYASPDGRKWDFKTQEDVHKYLRQGTMRHEDYEKRRKDLEGRLGTLTERERSLETGANTLLQHRQEYETKAQELDRVLKAMPREQYEQLKRQVQSGYQAEPQVPPELMQKIQSLEETVSKTQKEREEEAAQRHRDEIADAIAGQYEDFDRDEVEQLLQDLYQSPDGDAVRSLYETAYWATKGRRSVAEMQRDQVNRGAVRTGKQAPLKSPKGKVPNSGERLVHASLEEAAAEARKEFG